MLIRKGKVAQDAWTRYAPYCSYHCYKWDGIERARQFLRTLQ